MGFVNPCQADTDYTEVFRYKLFQHKFTSLHIVGSVSPEETFSYLTNKNYFKVIKQQQIFDIRDIDLKIRLEMERKF